MELTLKDRVLILNTVLPQFDTRKNMELKVSIDSKIAISEVDQKRIVIKDMGSGQINIGFTDAAAITETTDIALTDEYLVVSDSSVDKQQLQIYRKNTGTLVGTVSYKDLTDNKETSIGACVNLANMPDNRVLVVLSNDRKNIKDEFFILQL